MKAQNPAIVQKLLKCPVIYLEAHEVNFLRLDPRGLNGVLLDLPIYYGIASHEDHESVLFVTFELIQAAKGIGVSAFQQLHPFTQSAINLIIECNSQPQEETIEQAL